MRRVLLMALLPLLVHCTSEAASQVRKFTYAREFKYYDEQQMQSVMVRMSRTVRQLHQTLQPAPDSPEPDQRVVVGLLDELETTARVVHGAESTSNHPKLTENLDAFLHDVHLAREAAARQPPNYFLAGSVTGACFHCHSPVAPR